MKLVEVALAASVVKLRDPVALVLVVSYSKREVPSVLFLDKAKLSVSQLAQQAFASKLSHIQLLRSSLLV